MAVLGDYQISQPHYNAHPSSPVSCGATSWGTCCGEDLASCNTASCLRRKEEIRLPEALPNYPSSFVFEGLHDPNGVRYIYSHDTPEHRQDWHPQNSTSPNIHSLSNAPSHLNLASCSHLHYAQQISSALHLVLNEYVTSLRLVQSNTR